MNNKGFTLVEILAVVSLLGIMTGLAIMAYTRYLDYSKNRSYDIMASSASQAMEEYMMDYPTARTASFQELVEGQYLEPTVDPSDRDNQCRGRVDVTITNTTDINVNHYSVKVCCANFNYTYTFPEGGKTANSSCQA